MTLNNVELISAFVNTRQARGLSPTTCSFYHGYRTRFTAGIEQSLLDLSKDDIAQSLAALSCNPGGKHVYLRTLRAFYSWAEESALVGSNPCSKVRIKVPKPLRIAVRAIDIPSLLSACDAVRDNLAVAILADTGLRLSEVASMELGDVELEGGTITVWGKGAKQRVVCYGPLTGELMLGWIHTRPNTDGLLGLTPRGIAEMLKRLGVRTGIRCYAHAFRRTFACESV